MIKLYTKSSGAYIVDFDQGIIRLGDTDGELGVLTEYSKCGFYSPSLGDFITILQVVKVSADGTKASVKCDWLDYMTLVSGYSDYFGTSDTIYLTRIDEKSGITTLLDRNAPKDIIALIQQKSSDRISELLSNSSVLQRLGETNEGNTPTYLTFDEVKVDADLPEVLTKFSVDADNKLLWNNSAIGSGGSGTDADAIHATGGTMNQNVALGFGAFFEIASNTESGKHYLEFRLRSND